MESANMYKEFMEQRIALIAEACTTCGKCFEACPMTAYADFEGADPERVTKGVVDIIKGEAQTPEAVRWAMTCEKSGVCIDACPEDVNPREMLSYAKLKAQNTQIERGEILEASRERFQTLSRTIRLLSGLQLDPGIFKNLTTVHHGKKNKADAVFYFGCNILQTPHILLSCMDVFDRMGLDYEVAGGVGHCCGIGHIRCGDLEGGAAMGRRSLDLFKSYNPESVITFCPTCQMQYTEFINIYSGPKEDSPPFVHITQYLVEQLEKLRTLFVRPVEKRVAVHLHGGTDGVEDNVRTILRSVPGLELVEIDQLSDHGYQCPTLHVPGAKKAVREKLFASAKSAEVDLIATVYHGCHRDLCAEEGSRGVVVENFMSILGQAVGFEYPDWTKTFKLYEEMDRVLAEASELLSANGFNPEAIRGQLQKILYF